LQRSPENGYALVQLLLLLKEFFQIAGWLWPPNVHVYLGLLCEIKYLLEETYVVSNAMKMKLLKLWKIHKVYKFIWVCFEQVLRFFFPKFLLFSLIGFIFYQQSWGNWGIDFSRRNVNEELYHVTYEPIVVYGPKTRIPYTWY